LQSAPHLAQLGKEQNLFFAFTVLANYDAGENVECKGESEGKNLKAWLPTKAKRSSETVASALFCPQQRMFVLLSNREGILGKRA